MAKIVYGNKNITKPFIPHTTGPYAGKKVNKITMGGKTITLLVLVPRDTFKGTFTTKDAEAEFMAITDTVDIRQFQYERQLTMISMPDVKTIGYNAFYNAPLTSINISNVITIGDSSLSHAKITTLDISKARTIEMGCFRRAKISSLILKEARTIGPAAFQESPITFLVIPKATLIGDGKLGQYGPFTSIINAASTKVTLPKGNDINGVAFNSDRYKDYMFGDGNWDKITFTWV